MFRKMKKQVEFWTSSVKYRVLLATKLTTLPSLPAEDTCMVLEEVCVFKWRTSSRNKRDINILNDMHTYVDSLGGEEEHSLHQ